MRYVGWRRDAGNALVLIDSWGNEHNWSAARAEWERETGHTPGEPTGEQRAAMRKLYGVSER